MFKFIHLLLQCLAPIELIKLDWIDPDNAKQIKKAKQTDNHI